MVAVKGPISTVDLEAAGRLENGDLEAFLASVGDGTKLPVGGPDPNRPGRGLLRLRDCVVPGWDVLEVGEEREDVVDGSPDRQRV